MTVPEAIVLGIVQGFTEFLPVSSSGHLVLFQKWLGLSESMIAFDVMVHLGTLLAVIIYYKKDLWEMARGRNPRLLGFLLITTFVTGAIGIIFKEFFLSSFESSTMLGLGWLVTGILLIASRYFQRGGRTLGKMKWRDAAGIGLAQSTAIFSSVSRSGATILAALACGLERGEAARYSFLASIFAIAAAGLYELKGGVDFFNAYPAALTAGFLAAAVSGYLSVAALLKIVKGGKFFLFGVYCLVLGIAVLKVGI